jgi:hypothetical protein
MPPWVLHDLRRSVATHMAELGIQPHIVEAVLNHMSGHKAGVAGVYNKATYAPEKRAALEADVLPTVARTMSDLPRPLKRWDAPWPVREILAAGDERFAGFAQVSEGAILFLAEPWPAAK